MRYKFKDHSPEHVLYEAVRKFAKQCGFRAIGIRKDIHNKHVSVSSRATSGEETLYAKVAKHAGHRQLPSQLDGRSAYTFERL